jgi:hypothetical protein
LLRWSHPTENLLPPQVNRLKATYQPDRRPDSEASVNEVAAVRSRRHMFGSID